MSSALLQTLLGAVAAIAGGLGAAIWQTYRADKVAQRIRLAERREYALLDLYAKVTEIHKHLRDLHNRAVHGQNAAQYSEARQIAQELSDHWDGRSSGVIRDQTIIDAYTSYDVLIRQLSGGSTLQRIQQLSAGDRDSGQRFANELGKVLENLTALKEIVSMHVTALDRSGTLFGHPRRRHR